MPRKTTDPRIIELRDKQERARAAFVRWYARMRRAVTAMETQRLAVARMDRRIARLEEEDAAEELS